MSLNESTIVKSAKRLSIYKYDLEGDTNSEAIPTPASVKRNALGVFHITSADSSGRRTVKKNKTIPQYSDAMIKYTTLGTTIASNVWIVWSKWTHFNTFLPDPFWLLFRVLGGIAHRYVVFVFSNLNLTTLCVTARFLNKYFPFQSLFWLLQRILHAMSDQRVDFLVESVVSICQITERDRLSNKLLKSRDVNDFLDDPRYVWCHCSKLSIIKRL